MFVKPSLQPSISERFICSTQNDSLRSHLALETRFICSRTIYLFNPENVCATQHFCEAISLQRRDLFVRGRCICSTQNAAPWVSWSHLIVVKPIIAKPSTFRTIYGLVGLVGQYPLFREPKRPKGLFGKKASRQRPSTNAFSWAQNVREIASY